MANCKKEMSHQSSLRKGEGGYYIIKRFTTTPYHIIKAHECGGLLYGRLSLPKHMVIPKELIGKRFLIKIIPENKIKKKFKV